MRYCIIIWTYIPLFDPSGIYQYDLTFLNFAILCFELFYFVKRKRLAGFQMCCIDTYKWSLEILKWNFIDPFIGRIIDIVLERIYMCSVMLIQDQLIISTDIAKIR